GWGLAGFCPGPAMTTLGAGMPEALVFVPAMLAGMAVEHLVERRRASVASSAATSAARKDTSRSSGCGPAGAGRRAQARLERVRRGRRLGGGHGRGHLADAFVPSYLRPTRVSRPQD